jgi:hypothetical protein
MELKITLVYDPLETLSMMGQEWLDAGRPSGPSVGTQTGFQNEVGIDVDAAASLAMEVFCEVYRLPDGFKLDITEN